MPEARPAEVARSAEVMLRTLYTALLYLLLPFLPLRLWWRGRHEPEYRRHVLQRFGRYAQSAQKPLIWIHAVSLGETRAAEPLVKALQARFAAHEFLLTHMTATGRQAAQTLFPDALTAFLPYDYPFAVSRFLRHFRPELGVLMETEIWPNLIHQCAVASVPLILANARLSERSARGYRRVFGLARDAFGSLAAVAAQSEADADRLKSLGARNVVTTGNLKFDIAVPPRAGELAQQLRAWFGARPVWLLASTREGEEALVVEAIERHAPLAAGLLVVIVPRHPQRFDEVARLLASRGHAIVRRTEHRAIPEDVTFFLGDSMGELAAYYLACDVAFVGGSLVPLGGQNLIEGCAAGAPVIIGPSTYNFADAARLAIEAGAALRVSNPAELVTTVATLLADKTRRTAMSEAGRTFAAAHRGAAQRMVTLIDSVVREQALSARRRSV